MKTNSQIQRKTQVVVRGEVGRMLGKIGKVQTYKVQTFRYKINRPWGYNIQHKEYGQ